MAERFPTVTHRSPPLGAVALVFVLLVVASVVTNALLTTAGLRPPGIGSPDDLERTTAHLPHVLRAAAFLRFGASIPLGIATATMVGRLRFHRVEVAGVYIALFGGLASSIFLALSGLSEWVLSDPALANDAGAMRVVARFAFATFGVGHVVPLGLLSAGISIPGLAFRLIPRWVAWFGLGTAALAFLASASLLLPSLVGLATLARFAAYVWLVGAGFTLPSTRRVGAWTERPHTARPLVHVTFGATPR